LTFLGIHIQRHIIMIGTMTMKQGPREQPTLPEYSPTGTSKPRPSSKNCKWSGWATRECTVTMGNGVFEQEYWHVGDEADSDELTVVDYRGFNQSEIAGVIKSIEKSLKNKGRSIVLDLEDAGLGDRGFKSVMSAIGDSKSVTELHVGENEITAEGIRALATAFSDRMPLRRVSIGFNMLHDDGVARLVNSLKNAKQLIHLSLRDCEIEVDGGISLGRALQDGACPRLLSLNVRQNLLLSEGVAELCRGLEEHPTLTALDLRENAFTADGAIGVARLITCSPNLKLVAICRNKSGNDGAKSIATAIRRNNVLEELWMQDSLILDPGAEELAKSMYENQTIVKMDLRLNMCDEGFKRSINSQTLHNRSQRR